MADATVACATGSFEVLSKRFVVTLVRALRAAWRCFVATAVSLQRPEKDSRLRFPMIAWSQSGAPRCFEPIPR